MAERVLLADPSQTIRALARFYLAGEDRELLTAADSHEAQELVRKERPAVVVADAMLRELDGYQLCRVLREQNPDLRFVLMTPEYLPVDEALAAEVGVSATLAKPFERETLLAALAGESAPAATPAEPARPTQPAPAAPVEADVHKEIERAVAERLPALIDALVPRIAAELGDAVREEVARHLPGVVADAFPGLVEHLRGVVEPVVWKSVPPLAEELVKEEIARLTEGLEEA